MATIIEITEHDKDCLSYHIKKSMEYVHDLKKCLKNIQELTENNSDKIEQEHDTDKMSQEYIRYN